MKDTRYNDLKKENNNIVTTLTGDYQRIANIYIKKARGYAIANLDTEMKINDCLKSLEEYMYKGVNYHSVILSDTDFVESHIQLLSKEFHDPNKVKSIIGISLIVLFIIIWTVISIWMRQKTPSKAPENLRIERVSNTKVLLKWDEVDLATEGYYVWREDSSGNIFGKFHTLKLEYQFEVKEGEKYTFYIQTKKTEYLAESKVVKIEYND